MSGAHSTRPNAPFSVDQDAGGTKKNPADAGLGSAGAARAAVRRYL
jgi:hypothetical protein